MAMRAIFSAKNQRAYDTPFVSQPKVLSRGRIIATPLMTGARRYEL
jgi:hypothetical protein